MSATTKCAICGLIYITEGPYPKCKSPSTLNTPQSQTFMKCVKQFDVKVTSPREQLQKDLVDWIDTWATAPYGVIPHLKPREDGGSGFARTITFGLAGTLDATLWIWSAKRFDLKTSRSEDIHSFKSVDELKAFCVEQYGATDDQAK